MFKIKNNSVLFSLLIPLIFWASCDLFTNFFTDVGLFAGNQAAFSLMNPLVSVPSYLLWSYCLLDTWAAAEEAYWKEQRDSKQMSRVRENESWVAPPGWEVKVGSSVLCLNCKNATRLCPWEAGKDRWGEPVLHLGAGNRQETGNRRHTHTHRARTPEPEVFWKRWGHRVLMVLGKLDELLP